jgi:hypothetical protein
VADCSGAYHLDFNAWSWDGNDPSLVAVTGLGQFWVAILGFLPPTTSRSATAITFTLEP